MKPTTQKHLWWMTVAAFLGMTLWPIWSARFPPMQDYPGQLFYAEVLRLHNDPASDYDRYYAFRFHPVYATFYLTTLAFARFVPIELAGKLSLSLYPVLIAVVVLRLGRRAGTGSVAWGALLFFPFAFNQQYFYGNINFFLSLPILILALFDLEDFLGGPMRARTLVRQACWQVVLVVTHPLSFLLFVAMAVVSAILSWRRTDNAWRKLAATVALAAVFLAATWLEQKGARVSGASANPGLVWLPPSVTLGFFALMFDGMQALNHADLEAVLLWGGVFAVLIAAWVIARRARTFSSLPRTYPILLGLSILGMLALPFQVGDFSYINVRIASLAYFLLALCAAHLRFNTWLAGGLVGLLGLCLTDSLAKQARVSAETREILPVAMSIPPRSRVLPLVFEPISPELDSFWFAPHVQEYNYVPVLVGGGFNPYLFGSPIDPVRLKTGEERPAPRVGHPEEFTWERHAADYSCFLVQGAPNGLAEYLGLHCNRISASGKWTLFERKPE